MKSSTRRLFIIFALLACAFAPAAAHGQTPVPAAQDTKAWKKFTSPEGRFSVLLPATPTEQSRPVETALGRLDNRVFMVQTPADVYMVAYADFPEPVSDPDMIQKMLDGGRDKALSNVNGKLTSEKNIKLDGHAGREWHIEMPEGLVARARAYWVKKRLYQALVIVQATPNATPQAARLRQEANDKFFDSFALTAEGAAN